ncbi:MAG: alanine--tRNA ligase, partial [Candidatus Aureabacteria bacterium]|nr:alanine--tRNA ligase [Candidatus Auribacterota bacterium]
MKSAEIRTQFMDYFKRLGHHYVPSAPLVPADDPTLLFTNAGMNQFKDVFLSTGTRGYTRAVNSQKCMRVSGKHNDIEDVGVDTYHHTFFEMLGNWSFGDYYKGEAIKWAWELLTREWKIDPGKLWVTVYQEDGESARLWSSVTGIAPERVLRFGQKDNFWEMAETGPCGPCSEIHIDMGERHCRSKGEKGHRCAVNSGCGRFIELWNLVFIQYNRAADGTLCELPQKHVDTGMGFERLVAVLQGVDSNYATDLFLPIIKAVEGISEVRYDPAGKHATAFRAIADHARAMSFALADGALPSNDGRGYVLRMILRRAVRYGRTLGMEEPFLYTLVPVVASAMGDAYPELRQHREHVGRVILSEEERFHNTLTFGSELLSQMIMKAKRGGHAVLPGEDLFKLYDTYGFPVDLTALVAREEGCGIDREGFERLMNEQKEKARANWKAAPMPMVAAAYRDILKREGASAFCGYGQLSSDAVVRALLHRGKEAERLGEGQEGEVVLDRTPFYAESGGQLGDTGRIEGDGAMGGVTGTSAPLPGLIIHSTKVINGELTRGQKVRAEVDGERRAETARNHTAT